ncbi:MAG: molybdopterin molybdotransferase MoeA, partial [Candidatus Omnitrophica bacterium]|nr:molybdopterin molybdotransferase MoeA [Candidatus Omnitrophota bacterium]
MTGAPVPEGADTILPIETAKLQKSEMVIRKPIQSKHIHKKGEELKVGEVVLRKHTIICPATIGLLVSLGVRQINVFKKPRVSLLTTGTELASRGTRLASGKIYDSNLGMLRAALQDMGLRPVTAKSVRDDVRPLKNAVHRALERSDVLIVTGGVSVGDYDFARKVFSELEISEIFWKVSQKPGKPLYFGKSGKRLVFGLPGNPAAAYTCFYEYVFPALRWMMGHKRGELPSEEIVLGVDVKADRARTLFLKAKTKLVHRVREVFSLKHQGSHMISSLCEADSFMVVRPRQTPYRKGEIIRVDYLK